MNDSPEPKPVYREGIKLHSMLRDQVSRDLSTAQILDEVARQGFKIDASVIAYYREKLNQEIDQAMKDKPDNTRRGVPGGTVDL